jgi:hypothetical protein
MGVLTSVFQVPVEVLKQFKREPKKLNFLIYSDEVSAGELAMAEDWTAPTVSFDKAWEDMATILRQVGYYTTGSLLEYGATRLNSPNPDAFCRSWRKTKLKKMKSNLKGITMEQLKQKALSVEDLTDWNGDCAHPMLDYYLQSFDPLHAMIKDAIDKGDAIIAISS